jgi:hypothetical protein
MSSILDWVTANAANYCFDLIGRPIFILSCAVDRA